MRLHASPFIPKEEEDETCSVSSETSTDPTINDDVESETSGESLSFR